MIDDRVNQKKLIKEINKNLNILKGICEQTFKKYNDPKEMKHKEYIHFVFSSNIIYRIQDYIYLNKKLTESKNNFDSSLYVLSRIIVEEFFYLSYLLSDLNKVKLRLEALTCYNCESNIRQFNCLIKLADNKKFILSNDPNNILFRENLEKKINEWTEYIEKHKNYKNNDPYFLKEIKRFRNAEEICKEYDNEKNIKTIEEGKEDESLEWMYNYIYRFQSMSVHQNLNDKEKVFDLYQDKKIEPNNVHILALLCNILEKTIKLK